MKTAIITGASSGLGTEYINATLKLYPEVEKIWLIARRIDRLKILVKKNEKCIALPLDLNDDESLKKYKQTLESKKPEVVLLINNAGFGKLGNAADIPVRDQTDMVRLNCVALTAVTMLTLPFMKRGATIIQVASIAAFSPTPRMTVYSSTKAFILSFSKGLRHELKSRAINVLACCPGPMETEFTSVANIDGRSRFFSRLPRCDLKKVAFNSLIKAKKGRAVYTNRLIYKIYRVITKLLPSNITMKRL